MLFSKVELSGIFLVQITTFNISLVVHGTVAENNDFQKVNFKICF